MICIGRCQCCLQAARLQAGTCPRCEEQYGGRLVGLIVRARGDHAFARQCLNGMTPAARLLFADACGFASAERIALGLIPGLKKCSGSRRLFPVRIETGTSL